MEKVRRKKTQVRGKVGRSRFTVFFQWFGAPEGRKVTSLKRRDAEPAGQTKDEKVHTVVSRSTFPSQNEQSTPTSGHLWKLRCRKSARLCGAKHVSKSKCAKHARFGPLLEVEMSKKCTPLWHEAHFQVKMYKTRQVRTTFESWDVEKVHAVVARSTFPSQNVQSTPAPDHFWKLRCRKSARLCGAKHVSKSKCTKHARFGPLLEVEMSKKCTPLWRSTFPSQNVQSTPAPDHFWKLRCRKGARRCGTKHKIIKTPHVRTTFWRPDVEKVHAAVARNTFPSQKCKKQWVLRLFWRPDVDDDGDDDDDNNNNNNNNNNYNYNNYNNNYNYNYNNNNNNYNYN